MTFLSTLVLSFLFHITVSTSPLQIIPAAPLSTATSLSIYYVSSFHTDKALYSVPEFYIKEARCLGELPQDVSQYPRGIHMRPSHKLDSGLIIAIEFENDGFPVEVWDVEELCACR